MPVDPCRFLRRLVVDKGNPQRMAFGVHRLPPQHREKSGRRSGGRRRLLNPGDRLRTVHQRDLLVILLILHEKLIPDPVHLDGNLAPGRVQQVIDPVDREIDQKRVGGRDLQLAARFALENLIKVRISRAQRLHRVLPPLMNKVLPQQFRQLRVAPLLRETDLIQRTDIVEVEELVINLHVLLVRPFRKHAGHIRHNQRHMKIFHHRDALVSFLNVEPAHVFIGLDRVADPFCHLRVVQVAPLDGKLRVG